MEHLPELTSVVRQVLGDPAAEPASWSVAPIGYARVHGGVGIIRVAGEARTGAETRPFAAILKRVARPVRNGVPLPVECEPYGSCWSRELPAARSGLLDDPPGIKTPRCYTAVEDPDGGFRLWHEEVVEEYVGPWPITRYGLAARHLGRFNGSYLVDRPLPGGEWLARGRIGPAGSGRGSLGWSLNLAADPAAWQRPVVLRAYPPRLAERIHRLALNDASHHAALEALPRTLLHWDAYRANLLSRGGETYVIDWSCMGLGAPCEELGALIAVSLLYFSVAAEDARELAEACFAGYLDGLRDAGWRGEAAALRRTFATALSRWVPLAGGLYALAMDDPAGWVARTWSRTLDEALARWPRSVEQLLDLILQDAV